MFMQDTIWLLLLVTIATDVTASPIRFPEESSNGRSLEPYTQENIEPKFHHGLLHNHKKKKKRKKKINCLYQRYRNVNYDEKSSSGNSAAEGRFFFLPLINYYDTDIYVYNGNSGGMTDPCTAVTSGAGSLVSTGGSLINTGGSLINGVGSAIAGIGGNRPKPPPTPTTGGQPDGGGDDTDEDYDYSDGGDSDNNDNNNNNNAGTSNLINSGASTFGNLVGNAPTTVSNVLSSISNGFRPIFERPNRYFDYYVVRPFNRSINQLIRWF